MDIAYKLYSKFLGIHIAKNLKCNAHVHPLSLKLSKVFKKSLKEIVSSCMMRNIYHCKFQLPLRYGIFFLGGG
jgi:hypothetical protein